MKLRDNNPALSEHRTVFPYRVKTVTEVKKVLHSVANNSKLGNGVPVVARGKWRGDGHLHTDARGAEDV